MCRSVPMPSRPACPVVSKISAKNCVGVSKGHSRLGVLQPSVRDLWNENLRIDELFDRSKEFRERASLPSFAE
eukprot:4315359-Prymnesium_polylepis.1